MGTMTDEDFELMFIGHCLDRREHAAEARAVIDVTTHFSSTNIASAWHALWSLADEHAIFSPADWCDQIYRAGVNDATGIVHRARVLSEEPAAPLVREAKEVVRRAGVRAQVEIHTDSIKRLRGGREDADEIREDAIGRLVGQQTEATKHFFTGQEMARKLEDELDERAKNTGKILGFESGISEDLDALCGGVGQPGRMIVLGSRPGIGKTSLALQIAGAVMDAGGHSMILSFEMDAQDLAMRMMAQLSGIPTSAIERGRLTPEQRIASAAIYRRLVSTRSAWVDSPHMTIDQIVGRAAAVHAIKPLNLIVVDYLQLITTKNKFRGNRNLEVAEISRALKELSRQLKCTVLALSQLSRKSEDGDEIREPTLSDLRDSGAIEQDADQIWLLFRRSRDAAEALLKQDKNRRGPCGRVTLSFNKECTAFGYATSRHRTARSPTDELNDLARDNH
jgi:replicative DNA helicase